MDTFFEQIIAVKKTGKDIAAITGIWFLAFILCFLLILFMEYIGSIAFLLVAGILFGAFKLCGRFNIEYEYIVTNGTMDIDKIISKSSRKRMLSFKLSSVSSIEKFNPVQISRANPKDVLAACNVSDPNAYLMVFSSEGKGTKYLVFSPDERVKGAIIKFVPKFIANSAFK